MEFDIVAQSIDGNSILIGEAKLRAGERKLARLRREMQNKVAKAPFVSSYRHVHTVLFIADDNQIDGTPRDMVTGCQVFSSLK